MLVCVCACMFVCTSALTYCVEEVVRLQGHTHSQNQKQQSTGPDKSTYLRSPHGPDPNDLLHAGGHSGVDLVLSAEVVDDFPARERWERGSVWLKENVCQRECALAWMSVCGVSGYTTFRFTVLDPAEGWPPGVEPEELPDEDPHERSLHDLRLG